ncbi:porin [Massilia forsythiae]|uniref:Porin n=1 Tax=Massilia forsythiae TaxID=2728020 RepID=A0A7Z2VX84_9BURK|nr:porin [Massilia forsythiae]QJE00532.1 porin [Massilia forsythiae]
MKRIGTAVALNSTLIAGLLTSGGALAQSNTEVYGIVDVLVGPTTNITKDKGTVWRVSASGMNVSRLGFRGGEDIGDGLKAVYQLEMGIAPDTGTADTPLFKRQATVGLEGRWGRLVMGRSFTSVYDFMLPYDPMGYAPFYSWVPTGNASGASKYGMTTGFDNLVKYTGKAGNLSVGLTYGAGEQSASNADGVKGAAAVNYVMGPVAVVATYERVNGNLVAGTGTRDATTAAHVGAMFTSGGLKLQAGARDYRLDPAKLLAPDVRARLYWLGVNYLVAPQVTLTGAAYYQDVRNVPVATEADPVMYVARAKYALSKRTDLYTVGAYAKAKHHQLVSLSRDDAGFDCNQRSLAVGIQHRF